MPRNNSEEEKAHGSHENGFYAVVVIMWRGPIPNSANSMTLGGALAKQSRRQKQPKERWSRRPSHCRRSLADVRRAGRCEGGNIFRARTRSRSPTTSEVLGTPRCHQP